jgi:hypothetical protein
MLSTFFNIPKAEKQKDSYSVSFDKNWLVELSITEASSIVGGYKIENKTGTSRSFYNLGKNTPAKLETLQPGDSADYPGEYITYNTLQPPGFNLTTKPLSNTGSLVQKNGNIDYVPNTGTEVPYRLHP